MSSEVLYAVGGGVATITLNRPERLNAATFDLAAQLIACLADAEGDDEVRVTILTGAGRAFCAGDDVEAAWTDPRLAGLLERLADVRPAMTAESAAFLGAAKPLIGAINGIALGVGMDLAVMCDLLVGSEQASFGFAHIRMGLMADAPSYWRLPQLVGAARAADLLLTGRTIDAQEAARIGLVCEVVPPEDLLPRAHEVAGRIAANPPLAVRHAKEALRRGVGRDYGELAELAGFVGNGLARLFQTRDHKEAVAAFIEKRAPTFQGR